MTSTLLGIIIALAGAVFFLASGGRRGRWLFIFALALLSAGAGAWGMWMLEKGPQTAFAHLPFTINHLAWTVNGLLFVGLGGLLGTVARGVVALFRRKR